MDPDKLTSQKSADLDLHWFQSRIRVKIADGE